MPAFIAANYVMTYYSAHNICPLRTKLPQKTDTVVVNRNVHLSQIAAVLDIDIDMLRTLNPEYRRDIVPGLTKPSAIKLALNDVTRFIDNQDSIYNYNANELLSKRDEVAVPDDVPTFTTYKKTKKGRKATVRKGRKTTKTTARRKTTTAKSRKTAAKPKAKAKAKPKAKAKTTKKSTSRKGRKR